MKEYRAGNGDTVPSKLTTPAINFPTTNNHNIKLFYYFYYYYYYFCYLYYYLYHSYY